MMNEFINSTLLAGQRRKSSYYGLRTGKTFFINMLTNELTKVLEKLKQYWRLKPKPVKAIIKAGVDSICLDLDEDRDILITSPPYLQAQEYIRTAKMDLFWLGYSEDFIKELSKKEIPYRDINPCPIYSETYLEWWGQITDCHLQRLFERYFWGVLSTLTRLQEKVRSYLFLFVGPATIRTKPVPIDRIFSEHLTALGWHHEITLVDTIIARVMFTAAANPATGLKDQRMMREHLVVLRR